MRKVLSSMLVSMLIVTGVSAAYENNIVDVTNGEEIRGVSTPADAGGFAKAGYHDGEYMLHVELSNLGDPVGDDFYEGWVVRKSPFAFISTGELEKKDGKYINHFTSSTDYTDYDFYVLTLEPNDGNPAPADHIVEGDVVEAKVSEDHMMNKDDTMMKADDGMMKKKNLTSKQKALRKAIKEKIQNAEIADFDIIFERIENFKSRIDEKGYSEKRKERILEILDALIDVLSEKKMEMMMSK